MAAFFTTFFLVVVRFAVFFLPAEVLADFVAGFTACFLPAVFLAAGFTAPFFTAASFLAENAGNGLAIMVQAARKARIVRRMGVLLKSAPNFNEVYSLTQIFQSNHGDRNIY
ncbi:MAG: hypothetical protein RBT53_03940 [Azonexus sp.]|nr:hypothetical protein [Azonexus sp.]